LAAGFLEGALLDDNVLAQYFYVDLDLAKHIIIPAKTGITGAVIGLMVLAAFRKSEDARKDDEPAAAREEHERKQREEALARREKAARDEARTMTPKVFISYRRDDSAGHAGRVMDRLESEFGRDHLFMDVDSIPLGMNFVKVLREEVAKCRVLLAVIGPNWSDARDEDRTRRLENPNDFVRIEIATALQRDISVIPILLDGAKIPKANQLPDELKELASRNGLDVRHVSFRSDMDKLIRGLKSQLESME
jgi:hypothetical protein